MARQGWKCPVCNKVHAPWVAQCNCHAPSKVFPADFMPSQDEPPEGDPDWSLTPLKKQGTICACVRTNVFDHHSKPFKPQIGCNLGGITGYGSTQ